MQYNTGYSVDNSTGKEGCPCEGRTHSAVYNDSCDAPNNAACSHCTDEREVNTAALFAKRAVEQGGVTVDGEKVTGIDLVITKDSFKEGKIVVKKGKKSFLKIELA